MGRGIQISSNADKLYLAAKARQASKLIEIRESLVDAGYDTAAKQAAVLGVSRPTAWALLNRDRRAGPSSVVIKRILSSPTLPPAARRKIEEYVTDKIAGLYGHTQQSRRCFREQISTVQLARAEGPLAAAARSNRQPGSAPI